MKKRVTSIIISIALILSFIPTTYVFASNSITIGDYIQFGSYLGEPIIWRCVVNNENGLMLLSDRHLSMKCFSGGTNQKKAWDGEVSYNEVTWGSNVWETSDIRSWLNSTETAGNVKWLDGTSPDENASFRGYNPYNNEAGFLSVGNFRLSEVELIKTVSLKTYQDECIVSNIEDISNGTTPDDIPSIKIDVSNATYRTTQDKMFIPDLVEIKQIYANREILGDDYYYNVLPTEKAKEQTDISYGYDNWDIWLRCPDYSSLNTPYDTGAQVYVLYQLDNGGHFVGGRAACGSDMTGIRPAFYLSDDIKIKAGLGTKASPYTIMGADMIDAKHSYTINDKAMTWAEAKAECEKVGGHLLTISSQEEQEYINKLLKDKTHMHSYWMGGYNDESWKWLTDEKFNYSNWSVGEPNSGNNVVTQIYAPGMGETYKFKWDDTKGDGSADFEGIKRGYICEWDHDVISDSTSTQAPIIKSIRMGDAGSVTTIYNLRYNRININKGSPQKFRIVVDIDWKGAKSPKVYLTQGATVVNENTFAQEYANNLGVFNYLSVGQAFQPNLPIYVVAVDEATGESSSALTTLTISDLNNDDVYKETVSSEFSFKLGKDIALTLPSDLPIIGGLALSWKLDPIPLTFSYENKETEKMCIAIGANVLTEDRDGVKKFKEQFDFPKYKQDIIDACHKQNRTLAQIRNDFKISNNYKMSLFDGKILGGGSGGAKNSVDILGYAEVIKDKDGWNFNNAEGYLKAEITVSYQYNGQIFLWVIPCYYTFGGSLGAGLEATFKGVDPTNFTPEINAYLSSKVGLNLGAGVGVSKVATFGAKGSGALNLKSGLGEQFADKVRVWLEANVSFELVAFGKVVASKPAWKLEEDKGIIWSTFPEDAGKAWIDSQALSLMSINNDLETYSANTVYENESRDYLSNSMEWYGDMSPISLFAADYSNKNLSQLAENIYAQAQPQLFSVDGKKILVFTTDNDKRAADNKQMLVYSTYNDDEGIWSAPVPVNDDGTADFYPSVSGEYLVWQNQKTILGEGLSLAEIGKQGEIVIAKWNGNGFDAPVSLTDNDSLDTLPKISVNGDEISAIWLKNSANDILGVDGNTSIAKKVYNGSVWGEEVVLKDNLNAVTDLSVGYSENALNVAYVHDVDDDITTINDREVYLISSSEKQVTDNEVLDSNAIINNGKLYWYSENNIHFMNLADGTESTVFEDARYALADGFTVSEDNGNIAILWSASEDESSEIKGVLYQDGAWGDVITVSELGAYAKYPTCILEDDGTILTSFTAESDDVTSLYTLGLFPSYDLEISDICFDETKLTLNSENEFETIITNNGELPVEGYTINVYNEDETLNNSIVFEDTIKAGESNTVVGKFITGDFINYESIKIEVVMNDNEEYVYDNNTTSLTIGNGDISIDNISVYEMLPASLVKTSVSNIGYSNIESAVVCLRADSVDGEIIQSETIFNLEVGDSRNLTFAYNPADYENTKWYVTVETENKEVAIGNNETYFVNECAVGLEDYKISILNYSYADKQLTVNAYVKNNTNDVLVADTIFAVYSKDGRLKGITNQPLSIGGYSDTGIDVWFENYNYANGDFVKMFVWRGLNNIKPMVEAKQVTLIIN